MNGLKTQLKKMEGELHLMVNEIREREGEMRNAEDVDRGSEEFIELELQRMESEAQQIESGSRERRAIGGGNAESENPMQDALAALSLIQQNTSGFGNLSMEDEKRIKRETVSVRWVSFRLLQAFSFGANVE